MEQNTYKSQRKRGLFAYLEQALPFRLLVFYGLPERYIPRLLLLFVLGLIYVGNTHYHESMLRKISQLKKRVNELKVDYTTLKASYMSASKQSAVAQKAAKLGLQETKEPPITIKRK